MPQWVTLTPLGDILYEGLASGFVELGADIFWMTSVIAHVIIALELGDREAAAQLLPVIEPYASVISFNGATSQACAVPTRGSWHHF